MSDFTDKELIRQMKTMNTHLRHIDKSLAYLEHCFKPIRGKYKLDGVEGNQNVSEKITEVQNSPDSL